MSDLASRSAAALRAVMRADGQAPKERFPRGVHVGRTRQTTR
jgi:hypothetical protein